MTTQELRGEILNRTMNLAYNVKQLSAGLNEISQLVGSYKQSKTHIIIHHSATADSKTVSWSAIRRYHTSYRHNGNIITEATAREYEARGLKVEHPWKEIGYQYGIELIENEYEILLGRMITDSGAHCPQGEMNEKGIGICFVGNFDNAPPSDELYLIGARLVGSLCKFGGILVEHVQGHHDYNSGKSCPGRMFDLNYFREKVKAHV